MNSLDVGAKLAGEKLSTDLFVSLRIVVYTSIIVSSIQNKWRDIVFPVKNIFWKVYALMEEDLVFTSNVLKNG